jgi:hypothetical protein
VTSWIDNTGRRLASAQSDQQALAVAAPWDTRITRRRTLELAAGTAIALGAGSAFGPFLESARADDYCLVACQKAARNKLQRRIDFLTGAVVKTNLFTVSPIARLGSLSYITLVATDDVGNYFLDLSTCRQTNCGDPKQYPPPPPPPDPTEYCKTCTAYCTVCATVSTGYICCVFPPKDDGSSPCCPT